MICTYVQQRQGTLFRQLANSPMYDTYMSTPGNTAKLGATHSNIQTAQSRTSLVGSEPSMHQSAHKLSQRITTLCQPGIVGTHINKVYELKKMNSFHTLKHSVHTHYIKYNALIHSFCSSSDIEQAFCWSIFFFFVIWFRNGDTPFLLSTSFLFSLNHYFIPLICHTGESLFVLHYAWHM